MRAMRTLALFAVLFAFASIAAAQTILEQVGKVEKPKDLSVTYDKFKNLTRVEVKGVVFGGKENRSGMYSIGVRAYFDATGQSLDADAESFSIVFESFHSEWIWLHDSGLIMLIDGERVDFGSGKQGGDVRRGGVDEWVWFTVNRAAFERIVKANSVELQLGSFSGSITNRTLARTTRKLQELLQVSTKPQSH